MVQGQCDHIPCHVVELNMVEQRAECPPGHLALGHNVPPPDIPSWCKPSPLVQNVPPTLVMLGRAHMERTGQFEVSSIKESSMEDAL